MDPQQPQNSARKEQPLSAAEYGGVAFQFVGALLLFLYLGKWLDAKLGTAPWLLMVGVFGGAAIGFYAMYRKLMRQFSDEQKPR